MINVAYGETIKITHDWTQELERDETTLSASVWEYDGSAVLTSPTLVDGKATVLFAPTTDGILTNEATLADGQTLFQQWEVYVG